MGSSFATRILADYLFIMLIIQMLANEVRRCARSLHTSVLRGPLLTALVSNQLLMIECARDRGIQSSDIAFAPFRKYSRKRSEIGVS